MRKLIIVSFLVLLISVVLYPDSIDLSINDAVERGIEKSKELKISKKETMVSRNEYKTERADMFPEISISSTYLKTDQKEEYSLEIPDLNKKIIISPKMDSRIKNTLEFKQPLFAGFGLYNKTKLYSEKSNIKQSKYREDRRNLIFEINRLYWNIIKLNNMHRVLEKNKKQIDEHLKNAKNYYKQGMATKVDILTVQEKISEIDLIIIENENKTEKLKMKLKNILDISTDRKIILTSKIEKIDNMNYEKDECIEKALNNREIIKQVKINTEIQSLKNKIAKSGLSPKLSLIGKYHYDKPNNSIQPLENEYKESWEIGFSLSMDIFKGGERFYEIAKTNLEEEKSEIFLENLKDNIKSQVINAYLDYNKYVQKIEVIDKKLSGAEENYRISKNMYNEGLIKSSDFLETETSLMKAEMEKLNALVDLRISELNLKKAMGVL